MFPDMSVGQLVSRYGELARTLDCDSSAESRRMTRRALALITAELIHRRGYAYTGTGSDV